MSDQIERLKKLKELALRGVGGEQIAAQKLLDRLMQKYGVQMEKLDEETIFEYDFVFHGKEQLKILVQICFMVTNNCRTYRVRKNKTGRLSKTIMRAYCTQAQKIEIDFLFDFYCQLWEKEKELFLTAFISKHDLAGISDEVPPLTLSTEERLKVSQFMSGITYETPTRRLQAPKDM